jgi:PncC family amidohydrolase
MDDVVLALFGKLQTWGWMIASAESCTGGLIAARLTEVPGSSVYVDRGFITYSNQAKIDMLGVPPALIEDCGAVSAEVAEAMAKGALQGSRAQIAVSVTGIAGPGGGTEGKPVGLVYVGVATWEKAVSFRHQFEGDRRLVRLQSVDAALGHILDVLE